jgi:hypothetical protein
MSIPIRIDYKLPDGTIHENQGGFTVSYSHGWGPKSPDFLRREIHQLQQVLREDLAQDPPNHWAVRDKWILDAVEFRETPGQGGVSEEWHPL